ncbi:hypothetical protein [Luteitalea pratensis]|nr:hypothetical protein [Luteitalea pratensis]
MAHWRSWLTSVIVVAVVILSTMSAQAQPVGPLTDVGTQVEVGEKVRVLRLDGSEVRGELSAVEPTSLDVEVDGRVVRIDAADVREVGVKDGVYNGILIGMGAGLAGGLVAGQLATSPDDGNLRGLVVMVTGAAGLGVGIGLGAALDAAAGHFKLVYRAAATVRVAPFAATGGYGAVVAVAW